MIKSGEIVKQIIHELIKTNLVLTVVFILQYQFTSKSKDFLISSWKTKKDEIISKLRSQKSIYTRMWLCLSVPARVIDNKNKKFIFF